MGSVEQFFVVFPYVCVRASWWLLDVPFYAFLFFYSFVTAHLLQTYVFNLQNLDYLFSVDSFVTLWERKGEEAVMQTVSCQEHRQYILNTPIISRFLHFIYNKMFLL